jgi:adenine/guanine/hypoxanthine permease
MTKTTPTQALPSWDRWFHMTERGATLGGEIRGGLVTFVTMAYIVVLNPLIIGTMPDKTGHYINGDAAAGGPVHSIAVVAAATALIAGVMSILMGAIGRFPVALAAGLGLNGFLAFTLAPAMSWPEALGLMVIAGVVMFVLVLTGFRIAVFRAVPEALKYSIGAGIGLFIALIGLHDAGIVRTGPVLVTFGVNGELAGWPIFTFVFGLLLMIILVALRVRGGILMGLLGTVVLAVILESVFKIGSSTDVTGKVVNPSGWSLNVPKAPAKFIDFVNPTQMFHLNLTGGFQALGVISAVIAIFSLLLSDFFDTMGTITGLASEADLLNENGEVEHLAEILVVDSVAVIAGGLAGTSSNTAYIESASGIGDGARTGIASIVTGALFLLAIFVAPLTQMVPYEAAAPALVIVGFLMMTQIRKIPFDDYSIAIPSFLTIILMPFTYSITNGIGAGLVTYVIIKIAQRDTKSVPALLWVIFAAFLIYFGIHPLKELFNV